MRFSCLERFPRDRPVREIRTPVNGRNQPPCDNGEGVARHSLTHLADREVARRIAAVTEVAGMNPTSILNEQIFVISTGEAVLMATV